MNGGIIYLRPLDVLMLRKPRPFVAGEGTLAGSLPLPPPNTISGAVAFYLLKKKGMCKEEEPEKVLDELNCKIFAYGWAVRKKEEWTRLYKAPQDALSEVKPLGNGFLEIPKSKEMEKYKDVKSMLERTWISENLLKNYLLGEEIWDEILKAFEGNSNEAFLESSLFEFEERPGLKLTGSKTAEEGMLYFASYLRPGKRQGNEVKELSLWVLLGFNNEDPANAVKEGEVLKLGGKGRLAEIAKVEKVKIKDHKEELKGKELYLASYGEYWEGEDHVNCPSWADGKHSFPPPLSYFGKYKKWNKSAGGEYLASPGAVFKILKDPELKLVEVTLGGNSFVLAYDEGHYRPINVYFVKEVNKNER